MYNPKTNINEDYSVVKTGTKVVRAAVPSGLAGAIAAWILTIFWKEDLSAAEQTLYLGGLVSIVGSIIVGVRNVLKETARRNGFEWLVPFLCLLLVVGTGCGTVAKTRHLETHWEQIGDTGDYREVTVEISAKTRAGMFGLVPEGVHNVQAMWSEEKDTVSLGQRASLDNTAQVAVAGQAFEALGPIIGTVVGALAPMIASGARSSNPDQPFTEAQTNQLNGIFQLIMNEVEKRAMLPELVKVVTEELAPNTED